MLTNLNSTQHESRAGVCVVCVQTVLRTDMFCQKRTFSDLLRARPEIRALKDPLALDRLMSNSRADPTAQVRAWACYIQQTRRTVILTRDDKPESTEPRKRG